MPETLIKPVPGEDFYVLYSSVVDTPTGFGTRAQLSAGRHPVEDERFERADRTGTSALWGDPPAHGWHEQTIVVREGITDPTEPPRALWGTVRRRDLRAFCESLQDDGYYHPAPGIVTWHEL